MPTASPKPCTFPGCGALVRDGGSRCTTHRNVEKREYDRRRPTSAQRGYGHRWQRARAQFLSANPLCVSCGQPANIVDHIVPPKGSAELFWSVENWQGMCARCHNRKTARQDGAFGNPRRGEGG
jgi:5-methylcytosine-specific restriction protein A